MAQNPHGHAILDKLSQTPLSRADLKSALDAEFGADAQFRTCQTDAISFDELFAFFIARGKVVESDGLYSTVKEKVCSHD
jgi:probable metal-binding protein